MSSGSVSTRSPWPPGTAAEKVLEPARGVGVGRGEDSLYPLVHLLDHGEQARAGLRGSSSWVARKWCRWVSASHSSRASGSTLPSRSSCLLASAARRSGPAARSERDGRAPSSPDHRDGHLRPRTRPPARPPPPRAPPARCSASRCKAAAGARPGRPRCRARCPPPVQVGGQLAGAGPDHLEPAPRRWRSLSPPWPGGPAPGSPTARPPRPRTARRA